jgi:hypothetical protein
MNQVLHHLSALVHNAIVLKMCLNFGYQCLASCLLFLQHPLVSAKVTAIAK